MEEQDELEMCKERLKDEIKTLINNEQIVQAIDLINEYESFIKDDIEIITMKAVILIMNEKLREAEDLLWKGSKLDNSNADVLFNLAFLYEIQGDTERAVKFYRKALKFGKGDELKYKALEGIRRLETIRNAENSSDNIEIPDYSEIIIKSTENKKVQIPSNDIFITRSNALGLFLENNAPLVSVLVLAYNNLEKYTKTCVESILEFSKDIDYELVLVDNGSSDGTFEYFQSLSYKRKRLIRITENKGANLGSFIGMHHMNGRYIICVANDIIVTKNWLLNMIICAESDERIGLIAPASDNISNLQRADLTFNNFEEMQMEAEKYNISDPGKWEERLRLITVMALFRKECLDIMGLGDYGFVHDFGDDDLAFRVRRAGYKAIFCGDVFVHHAGSTVTGVNLNEKSELLQKGRIVFQQKYYGIDAWQDAGDYEQNMIALIDPEEKRGIIAPEILGIDVRCGTPILQLKNMLRNVNVFDTRLSAFVQDAKYWLDLMTICEGQVKVDRIEYLSEYFDGKKFDYLLLGEPLNKYKDMYKLLNNMLEMLKADGHLLLKVRNTYDVRAFLNILGNSNYTEDLTQIDVEILNIYLKDKGFLLKKIGYEPHNTDDHIRNYVRQAVVNLNVENLDDVFNKMLIKDYVLDIVKQQI